MTPTMPDRIERIENSKDLKREIARLRALKAFQEEKIKQNVKLLQSSFEPANLVSEAASAVLEGAPLQLIVGAFLTPSLLLLPK